LRILQTAETVNIEIPKIGHHPLKAEMGQPAKLQQFSY
jgi:hypothetical protein